MSGLRHWYDEQDVELVESGVAAVDAAAHRVVLDSGQELEYQKLLIATGGRNRRFDVPGAQLPGIHQLRSVAECDAIKREVAANKTAVVVGMGFIGCEVAASLTQLGVRVTAMFPDRAPLERVLGDEVGAAFAAIHAANGVELRSEDQVIGFEGTERVEAAVTASHGRVACDFVVVGIGIEPEIPAFTGESVAQSNGVLVDESCRASAARRVTPPATSQTICIRCLVAFAWSTTTTASRWGARPRDRCSARPPPTTTSTPSGPINTSTSSSTPATPRSGTSSSSAGAWRSGS